MKHKYGLEWPHDFHDAFIDLVLAKHWREEPYKSGNLLPPEEHLLRAATELISDEHFRVSRWTEEHAYDFTHSKFCIVLGAAASSKSNDIGLFTLLDWITDPTKTLAILASTSAGMLQLRSFESVVRYFRLLKTHPKFLIPGKESKTQVAILNADDEDVNTPAATVKASIKGVAVHAGTMEEARANLQGAHMPYTRLILDELSAMKEAAMDARYNLSIGCKDFKFIGLCNPESRFDLACRHAEPLDGWESIDPETATYWHSKYGDVRRHNGFQSPGLKDPVRFPFLIKQAEIDAIVKESGGSTDTPACWTMLKGFPPPHGMEQTILTEAMMVQYGMRNKVTWGQGVQEPFRIAGLDPAFTSGGDQAILQSALVGYEAMTGLLVVAFEPEHIIPIKASSMRPDVYQVVDYVLDWAEEVGFDLQYLGVDESGTQRVGDILEVEAIQRWRKPATVCRVSFGSMASEFAVSLRKDTPARKEYSNQVTELWYSMAEFGQHNQIRGLNDKAALEFCQRRVLPKRPRMIETKRDMKKRIKHSPDRADACACALAVVRWILQTVPGATRLSPSGNLTAAVPGTFKLETLRMFDIDASARSYQNSSI